AQPAVDPHVGLAERGAAVGDARRLEPSMDRVEVGLGHAEAVVVVVELLAFREVDGEAVVDEHRGEGALLRGPPRHVEQGREQLRPRGGISGGNDEVIELDRHGRASSPRASARAVRASSGAGFDASAPRGYPCGGMKLGTSVRFLFPTGPATLGRFQSLLASMPRGAFIERPMGAFTPEEQARNLLEVAAAARAAGLDGLLTGDSHGANPGYAAAFSPLPTLARLMSVTGDMPVGRPPQFQAFGMEEKSRVGRLEETVAVTRALLAGERVTHRGRYHTVDGATISPLPRVPVEIWLGGT